MMQKKETMKCVLVSPGQRAKTVELENELSSLQNAVGGTVQAVYPFEDRVCILCNDEGKFMDECLPNRTMRDEQGNIYDILCGNFYIVGFTSDSFCSLTKRQLLHYMSLYADPEVFSVDKDSGKVVVMHGSQFDSYEEFLKFFSYQKDTSALQRVKEVLL